MYARYYKYKLCLWWDNQPASHYNNVVLNLGAAEHQQQRVESDRPHAVANGKTKTKKKKKRHIHMYTETIRREQKDKLK